MNRLLSFPAFSILMLSLLAGGCDSNQQAETKSLFEHEHETPAHWPNDVSDLCSKIGSRLDSPPTSPHSVPAELSDLISWIPEITADSNLTEAQWLPICMATESLLARIGKEGWTEQARAEAREICEVLAAAARKLRESEGATEGSGGEQ